MRNTITVSGNHETWFRDMQVGDIITLREVQFGVDVTYLGRILGIEPVKRGPCLIAKRVRIGNPPGLEFVISQKFDLNHLIILKLERKENYE